MLSSIVQPNSSAAASSVTTSQSSTADIRLTVTATKLQDDLVREKLGDSMSNPPAPSPNLSSLMPIMRKIPYLCLRKKIHQSMLMAMLCVNSPFLTHPCRSNLASRGGITKCSIGRSRDHHGNKIGQFTNDHPIFLPLYMMLNFLTAQCDNT